MGYSRLEWVTVDWCGLQYTGVGHSRLVWVTVDWSGLQ